MADNKGKGMLEWIILPFEEAIVFQVLKQNTQITQFLEMGPWASSHGLIIDLAQNGKGFPEFQDSTNTLFIQGTNHELDNKIDVTRFVSNKVRDRKINLLEKAMQELVDQVGVYYRQKAGLGIGQMRERTVS